MSQDPSNPIDREIEQALDGINLQEIDMAPRGKRASGSDSRLYDGTIVGISGDDVIVEMGPRMQGACPLAEFDEAPQVGERHRFTAHGQEDGLWILSMRAAKEIADWESLEVGSLTNARVTGQNQGGLTLKIGKHEAFMPASQVSTSREEDISKHIGQTLTAEVLEIDRSRNRVLLSRRRVQEAEAAAAMQEAAGRLAPGSVHQGKVTKIESFGAFVSLGSGIEGLVHVSNISHQRVENPSDVLSVGQEVQVKILEIKDGGRRIGLGIKQLEADPWEAAAQKYREDSVVQGKVTRIADFGAFVELEPGLDGLLHISQLGRGHVKNVGSVLSLGEELSVRISGLDLGAKRISLSRLDSRGAVIGSEESVDGAEIDQALASPDSGGLSTSLGDLFKKAMKDSQK